MSVGFLGATPQRQRAAPDDHDISVARSLLRASRSAPGSNSSLAGNSVSLLSLVPMLACRRFLEREFFGTGCESEDYEAVACVLDVSAINSPDVAERSHQAYSDFFSLIFRTVVDFGGDVMRYGGGDFLHAVWVQDLCEYSIATAALAAVGCMLELQRRIREEGSTNIKTRVGVATGVLQGMHLGGACGRWEYLLVDRPPADGGKGPVQTAIVICHESLNGQVVVSAETYGLVGNDLLGLARPTGNFKMNDVERSFTNIFPARLAVPSVQDPEVIASIRGYLSMGVSNLSSSRPEQSESAAAAAASAFPGVNRVVPTRASMAAAAAAAETLQRGLEELPSVCILCCKVSGLDSLGLEYTQRVVHALQAVIFKHSGALTRFIAAEKGVSIMAVFGAFSGHSDGEIQASLTALAMRSELRRQQLRCAIGLASGSAWAGIVGHPVRSDCITVGPAVGRAAWLMRHARHDILCDIHTHNAAQTTVRFETLPTISVPGQTEGMEVFRPVELLSSKPSTAFDSSFVVGRDQEIRALGQHLQHVTTGSGGATVVVQGEPGIGKSRLLQLALQVARNLSLSCVCSHAMAVHRATPFFVAGKLVQRLLDLQGNPCPKTLLPQELHPWASLLNNVIHSEFPVAPKLAGITREAREAFIRELLLALLTASLRHCTHVVIAVEDAHWLDWNSWGVLLAVSQQRSPSTLILLAVQRLHSRPRALQEILDAESTTLLDLSPLEDGDVRLLCCNRLGAQSIPDSLAHMLVSKASGIPLFAEELVWGLRDSGLVEVRNEQCILLTRDISAVLTPDDLPSAIIARVDRVGNTAARTAALTPTLLYTLQVSAIIGQRFSLETVVALHPLVSDQTHVLTDLATLETLNFVAQDPNDKDYFAFRHALIHEGVYHMILPSQRKLFHRRLADIYERKMSGLYSDYPELAHHWLKGADTLKGQHYLELAANSVLSTNNNAEAVLYLGNALALSTDLITTARLSFKLGDAYFGIADYRQALGHLLSSLQSLHLTQPNSRPFTASLLKQMVSHAFHRIVPVGHMTTQGAYASGRGRPNAIAPFTAGGVLGNPRVLAARVYNRILHMYFLTGKRYELLLCALCAVNTGGWFQLSPELAQAYATLAYACSIVKSPKWSKDDLRRAFEITNRVNDDYSTAYAIMLHAIVFLHRSEWISATRYLDQAYCMFSLLGERRYMSYIRLMLAFVHILRAQYEQSLAFYDAVLFSDSDEQAHLWSVWVMEGRSACLLGLGKLDDVIDGCQRQEENPAFRKGSAKNATRLYSALSHARKGDAQPEASRVTAIFEKILRTERTNVTVTLPILMATDLLMELWDVEPTSNTLPVVCSQMCTLLKKLSKCYTFLRPRLSLLQGWAEFAGGRPGPAQAKWRRTVSTAQALGLTAEEAIAHGLLGRRFEGPDSRRHLKAAHGLFEKIGAAHELRRLQKDFPSLLSH